jgi:putative DNA primase/helicase
MLHLTTLMIVGEESGGLHIHGDSRAGKTSCGTVGTSFGGNPQMVTIPWRATSNGLEATCKERCDGLLFLDEMGQLDAKEAGEIAYMIANGKGKSRMTRATGLQRLKDWRLIFLSTGEITLADKMSEIGKRTRAGQEIRLLNVPADAGAGWGIFENLHGAASPGAFAEQLRRATQDTQGAPLRVFLDHIARAYADDPETIKSALRDRRDGFIKDHIPAGASGQVRSACGRFGLIAAAGELAAELSLTGWPRGEATQAAVTCFRAWLDERGTIGDHDLEKAIQGVISYVERHGSSRFEDVSAEGFTVNNRVGYRKCDNRIAEGWRWEYFVLLLAWREELCKGYDHKAIEKAMIERKMLIPQGGRPSANVLCGRDGQKRV